MRHAQAIRNVQAGAPRWAFRRRIAPGACLLALALSGLPAAHGQTPGHDTPVAPSRVDTGRRLDNGAAIASSSAPLTPLALLLAKARRLLEAGQADTAWRALEAHLDEYAGDAEFDYLLGLAALDSGHPGHAILALERALINRPDFLQARAEIARAYFVAHERENARREFETVAAQGIPEQVRKVIGRYLDAIQRIDEAGRSKLSGALELEAGYDSNVNFGSTSSQWVLADGTAVVPLGISLPRTSSVLAAAGSLSWTVPISGAWQWTIGGRAALRRYAGAHTLDQDQFDLSSGFSFHQACHQFNMLAQAQNLQLGAANFRNALGMIVQWQCDIDRRTQLGAYLQHFDLDFPDEPARDARRDGIGLTLARVLDGAGRPILVAGLQYGKEASRRGLDNLSYDYRGARIAASRVLGHGWRGFATLAYEVRDFDGIEPFFGVARHDRQTDLRIGAERRLTPQWSITPALTLTHNRSTLAPNDFRRTQAGVVVHYRF